MAPAVTMSASLRLYATIPPSVINILNPAQEDEWPPAEPVAKDPDQLDASQALSQTHSSESLPFAMSSSSSLNQKRQTSALLAKDTLISFSDTGERIVCAFGRKFVVMAVDTKGSTRLSGEFRLETVGQSSGCTEENESITAVSCLPLFIPSISRASLTSPAVVAVGYSTGWLRIFTHLGNLLISQLLHRAPLTAIKIPTSPSNGLASNHPHENTVYENESDEEVMLLYADGAVVAIEGGSLWMAIRVCDAQQRSTNHDSDPTHTASFAYKKWTFRQESVSDVVSCGPAKISPSLMPTPAFSQASILLPTHATARYISVGTNPMLSYNATTETSKPLLSTVSLATMVASATRVTSAVLGFAMSWWGTSSTAAGGVSSAASPTSSPTATEYAAPNSVPVATGTPMPSILSLSDPDRRILRISLAPMPSKSHLAACVDSLGRVMLFDIEECEMVRMWKGIRDGQCAWIDLGPSILEGTTKTNTISPKPTPRVVSGLPNTASSRLFLAVYAPRRGQLEVWHMRYGNRVGAFSVGSGCSLLNVVNGKVGFGMVGGGTPRKQEPVNAKNGRTCFLVGPAGEIWTVNVDLTFDNGEEKKTTGISVKKPTGEKTRLLTKMLKPKENAITTSASNSTKDESAERKENDRNWPEQKINNGDLSQMEEAWELCSEWASNSRDASSIVSCIEPVKNIEASLLRCALIAAMWARDLSPMFKKVLALVEKARKAPKDAVCVREVRMGVPAIISLVNFLLALFNELEAITVKFVPGITYAAILSFLQRPEFQPFSAVAGEIRRALEEDRDTEDVEADQKEIDVSMIMDHKVMFKILLQIFLSEIRMVRPSRLLHRKDGSVFGGSVFGGGTRSPGGVSGKSPEQRLLRDRETFLIKLTETNPKSEEQWGKIMELARDLNVPVDPLRSSRAILLFALDDDERAIQMTEGIETGLDLKAEIFLYVGKRRLAKLLDDRNAEHSGYLQSIPEEVRNWLFDEQNAGLADVVKSVSPTEIRRIYELLRRAERSWASGDRKSKVLGGRIQTLTDLCNRMLLDH